MHKRVYQIAAESVSIGHPDLVADSISDAILQAFYEQDKDAHVAAETLVTENFVLIAGEYLSSASVDIDKVVRNKIADLGYTDESIGFSDKTVEIINKLHGQSQDIDMGVSKAIPEEEGAGDQGFMIGFASDEGENFMPLPISLARALTQRLTEVREKGETKILYPDGKSQVVLEYTVGTSSKDSHVEEDETEACETCDIPGDFAVTPSNVKVKTVLISNHHKDVPMEDVRTEIIEKVIKPVMSNYGFDLDDTEILVNPTGSFKIGGPKGDTGLTGRKLAVENYGPSCPLGGGATAGKDLTKTDRSGAYMARYIAKNIVGADLAQTCQVQISYAIGVSEPTSIDIATFGTASVPEEDIVTAVREIFDLRPYAIRKWICDQGINFNAVRYLGAYGNNVFPWEQLDKVGALIKYFNGSLK